MATDLDGNTVDSPEHVWIEDELILPRRPTAREIAQSVLRADSSWLKGTTEDPDAWAEMVRTTVK